MATAERRQAYRLHLQVPMFMRGTDAYGEEFVDLAKTLDISSGGAYLTSPRARSQGRVDHSDGAGSVGFQFRPGSGLHGSPIHARVLRQKEVGDVHLIGVQFLKPLD